MRDRRSMSNASESCEAAVAGDWRWQLQHAIRDLDELAKQLGVGVAALADCVSAARRFPVLVPPYYLSCARTLDRTDPIVRQCLPAAAELAQVSGEDPDPFDEARLSPVPGLVHRYPDRVLFLATNRCAVHCRHCLRKRLWAAPVFSVDASMLAGVLGYLGAHPEVREVIISGGDPLLLETATLDGILAALAAVPSIARVRIASRLPVVLPQRFDRELCRALGRHLPVWLVTHFNHPYELTETAAAAVLALLKAGVPVLNQTVLLRGINDDAAVLAALFTGLLDIRVKPYYLFHGDPVSGAMHFRTGIDRGLAIMGELRGRISGLAMPTFAIDLPGGAGKVPVENRYQCGENGAGQRVFRSYGGHEIVYGEGGVD